MVEVLRGAPLAGPKTRKRGTRLKRCRFLEQSCISRRNYVVVIKEELPLTFLSLTFSEKLAPSIERVLNILR